jgi:hypothetical protein
MVTLDNETKDMIADYFEPWELVEFLGKKVSTRDIIDAFEDEIDDSLEDIEEEMGISNE